MKKKKLFSIIAVAVLFLALGGVAVFGILKAQEYKRDIEYGYTRSLSDLQDSVNNISAALSKAGYANTSTEQNGLAAKLMRESSVAKTALAALPANDDSLNNVSKFISQVGDFSTTLSHKISAGGKISDDEFNSLQTLDQYAEKLKTDLQDLKLDFDETSFNNTVQTTAQDFTDFPSLIYDGPFSDHILQQTPRLTEGKPQVSLEEAQGIAADMLKTSASNLVHGSDTEGNMPTWNFTANNGEITISLTKAGGYISNMANTRTVDSASLSYDDASKLARTFLQSRGIENMEESYYAIENNICLINYAALDGDVICYPDLIKVGVALDNGEIVRFQSTGYIMNHTENRDFQPKVTAEQAQSNVSPRLTVLKAQKALIPTTGLNEVLCYEFLCSGKDDEKVLVYINADTGLEEDILILQVSDNGILAQ